MNLREKLPILRRREGLFQIEVAVVQELDEPPRKRVHTFWAKRSAAYSVQPA